MWALFLGFLAAAIIGFFEIKENIYKEKKKPKEDKFEYKRLSQEESDKLDQKWKESNYKLVLWMCLIAIVFGIIGLAILKIMSII